MGNYVEKNLRPNEQIKAKAVISWVPLIPSGIIAFLLLVSACIARMPLAGVLIGGAVVGLRALSIYSTELGVTDKKVIGKTGVILANSLDTYLEKIDNFSITETLGGKIFGYATLQICTTSARLRFNYVKNAMQFKNIVMDAIEAREIEKIAMQADLNAQAVIPMPQQPNNFYR